MTDRRSLLKRIGALGTAGVIAGCVGGDEETPTATDEPADSSEDGGGSTDESMDTDTATPTATEAATDTETPVPFNDGRVTFYMSPSEPQDLMESQYQPVKEHLTDALDTQTELQYASGYSAVLQSLAGGTGDIAETGPFAAALGVSEDRCEIILQRFGYGAWTYSSVIVTQEDSDVEELADLEGERVAFADRLSASGALFPLYMLKEAGLSIGDLPTDTGDADFTPQFSSHAEAFAALERGQVAAAGVGQFITLNDDRELKDGFRYVDTADDIPRAPIVVSPELSEDEKTAIKDALLDADESLYLGEDGEEGTDDDLWFSDVREADADTYQPVVDVANELEITADLLDG